MIIFLYIPNVSSDDLVSTVSIEPGSQIVLLENNFSIDVYCVPVSPIKAYEFKLYFDPLLIQANNVTEGDIFAGYDTFFSSGVIDNVNGSITKVFNVIIGVGNVTTAGSFAHISFTSKSDLGISDIDLYYVGITNETEYLPVVNLSGEVIVNDDSMNFFITDEYPVNQSVDVDVNISSLNILIRNPYGNPFYFEIYSNPDVGSYFAYNETNGTKICNISGLNYQTNYSWFVNCKDLITFNWTNNSYWFITQNYNQSGPETPPGDDFVIPNNDTIPQVSYPPFKPLKPVGPVYIERDVFYEYYSYSYDNDSDVIRFKFDWGDGSLSDWSEYFSSNISVSMNHSWDSISSFEIRVICQDENGFNSSWSDYLEVVVSESDIIGFTPVIDFNYSFDSSVSDRFVFFNASNSFDPDGVIVSYIWDFGDGETGEGETISHQYEKSGLYIVILSLTDNDGNFINDSFSINVGSDVGNIDLSFFDKFSSIFYYFIIIIILCVILVFILRHRVEKIIINRRSKKIEYLKDNIKKNKNK